MSKQAPKNRRRGSDSSTPQRPLRGDGTRPGSPPEQTDRRSPDALPGIVIRAYGKYFDVHLLDQDRVLLSTIKGTLKRERRKTDLVAVGDRVWVVDVGEGEGQIEAVEVRTRVLARPARNTEDVEQVIVANPDQVLFVFAVSHPEPHRRMLDRFLVLAEHAGLPAIVGVNKVDLDVTREDGIPLSKAIFGDYEAIYAVFYLSAITMTGIDELKTALAGKITVLAGPSGVGKSSLLNDLAPNLNRAIGDVSTATGKGRHTTTATQLFRLGPTTYIADTPGIRALAMHGVSPDELDHCFPELRPWLGQCFYADCTHVHEPGCAVREALEDGKIAPRRYESYAALRRGDAEES